MGKFKGMNQKASAAMDKKAVHQATKDAESAADREKRLQTEWNKGANTKGQSRADDAASKADEAARKRQEKATLLAEEEAALGPGGKVKKAPTLSKKGKGKKKNDFSMLEDALVGAADKKVKAKRASQRLVEEKQKQAQIKKQEVAEKPMDPLLANTAAMIGGTEDELIGRAANVAQGTAGMASGIDGALDNLNVSSGAPVVLSGKALFKAFEERMLPEVKEDYPGLKLSQYKEKIFQLWKKSSENPANRPM